MATQTTDSVESKIAEKIRLNPTAKDYEIASMLRRQNVVSAQVALVRARKGATYAASEPVVAKPRLRKLADFRREHDIAQKIRNELSAIAPESYATEEELRQRCEVPVQNWRRYADLPEFSPHKFKLEGVVYWASVETIREMKQITGRA